MRNSDGLTGEERGLLSQMIAHIDAGIRVHRSESSTEHDLGRFTVRFHEDDRQRVGRSPKVRLAIFRHYLAAGWHQPEIHAGFISFRGREPAPASR